MKKLTVIGFILLLSSCHEAIQPLDKPKNLIEREKFTQILTDMSVLESHIQLQESQVSRFYKSMKQSGDSLLASYGVTPLQYEENMDYYSSQQELMIQIYRDVQDNLKKQQ